MVWNPTKLFGKKNEIPKEVANWNTLPFEEKCHFMALGLESGERTWYMSKSNNKISIFPAKKDGNANEFDMNPKKELTEAEVLKLIDEKKVDNAPTVVAILRILHPSNF